MMADTFFYITIK